MDKDGRPKNMEDVLRMLPLAGLDGAIACTIIKKTIERLEKVIEKDDLICKAISNEYYGNSDLTKKMQWREEEKKKALQEPGDKEQVNEL